MFKRIFLIFFVSLFIFGIFPIATIDAEELQISSASVVLVESSTGDVLYEINKDEQRAIASITKVMTLLLTMEAIESGVLSFEDTLTASAYAASMGGSDIWLTAGETMTVDDLLKATVIMSANDAAVVLAEAISGTEEAFVEKMNQRASELGMTNTVFKNCNGLDEDGHVSTAYDVALMSNALIQYTDICKYTLTWMDYIRDGQTQLVNTNKMIKTYSGITGLKTGTTSTAGSCITATATRDGMTLIAVVLGASATDIRFEEATTLLNYGFAKWSIVSPEVIVPTEISVLNGMEETVTVKICGDTSVLFESAMTSNLSCEIEIREDLTAPVLTNEVVAYVLVKNGEETLKEIPILAVNEVEETSFLKVFLYLLKKM